MIHHPGHQNVDDVRVERAAAARLIGMPVERAFLDFKKAGVGDWLRYVEQQKIIEKDIGAGGQRGGRPVGFAVAHVVIRQAVHQPLAEYGLYFLGDRKRSLLIPQVAQVARLRYCRIVETHVGLLRAADPVKTWRRTGEITRLGQRACLGNDREQRTLAGIEHAARITFDDDAKHIVVLQQIRNFFQLRRQPKPAHKERIRAQARKYAE